MNRNKTAEEGRKSEPNTACCINRRQACQWAAAVAAGLFGAGRSGAEGHALATAQAAAPAGEPFRLNYLLASSLYGTLPLEEVLAEVHRAGARHIDIWPRVHADHREQIEAMGHGRFAELLDQHEVELGAVTRFDLGPLRLGEEMDFAARFGCRLLICGSLPGRVEDGTELKPAVQRFAEQLAPHAEAAAERGITIGIENHSGMLVRSPDGIRHFLDAAPWPSVGIALAPYHLPQDPELLAGLIDAIGPRLALFYAWQHGKGSGELPKEEELLQLPGRGPLDFGPLLAALKRIDYRGFTEVFMHPFPRGIPIHPTAAEATGAINRSRRYLEECLAEIAPAEPASRQTTADRAQAPA